MTPPSPTAATSSLARCPPGSPSPSRAGASTRASSTSIWGADFRLKNEADYKQWYGKDYADPALHEAAVYCIPELHRARLAGAKLIGNPGCYPTSIALGLAPAVKAGAIDPATLVIDSKSGATGAGRGLALNTHYTECNEAFAPYKVASHRHTPEIEQTLSELAGREVRVTFVPHLLAVNRGIVSTMYANFMPGLRPRGRAGAL